MAKLPNDGPGFYLTNEHPTTAARYEGWQVHLDQDREGFCFISRPAAPGRSAWMREFAAWCPTCRETFWYCPGDSTPPEEFRACCYKLWFGTEKPSP